MNFTRIPVLAATEPYGYSRDENTTSIAAFSETNKSETPEFMEEIHRMERSFTSKLENLNQRVRRVENRINSLAHISQINHPEFAGNRERHRHSKPVCYKCGRVGHIPYNCGYNYQPEGTRIRKGDKTTAQIIIKKKIRSRNFRAQQVCSH